MASVAKKNASKIDSAEAKRKISIINVFSHLNFTGDATEVEDSGGKGYLTSSMRLRTSNTKNAQDEDVKISWSNPSCVQDDNNLMNNTCFTAVSKTIDMSLYSGQSDEDESFTFSDGDDVSILDNGDWKTELSERLHIQRMLMTKYLLSINCLS